jgi:hypothetical protein
MVCAMRRDWSIPAADPVVTFLLVLVIGITSAPGVLSAPLWCRSLGGCGRPSSGKLLRLYHRDDQDLLVSVLQSSGPDTLAPKPIEVARPRAEMIFSRPEKAPPQTNEISVLSTCRNSCWGCLRPPCGGTEATVPSMILRRACCTPSPGTSRVIEGLSDLRPLAHVAQRHRLGRFAEVRHAKKSSAGRGS